MRANIEIENPRMQKVVDGFVSDALRGRSGGAAKYVSRFRGTASEKDDLRKDIQVAAALIKWQRSLREAEAAADKERAAAAKAVRGIGFAWTQDPYAPRAMFPDLPATPTQTTAKDARKPKVRSTSNTGRTAPRRRR